MKTPLPPQPSPELPDCSYTAPSSLIRPSSPTPTGTLYLSNLDDQHFLRFSIKYLYLFETSVPSDTLKRSLSRVLIDYYPLAGRLRTSCPGDDRKLEVDCNGEGALFAEASMDLTAEEVLGLARRPNRSWRKLLYRVEGQSFLNVPPLVVQATNLRCGGMILCTAICHCLCDGIGSSQFLRAWAHLTSKPHADLTLQPIHSRHVLRPCDPPKIQSVHPQYARHPSRHNDGNAPPADLHRQLQCQPLVPVSLTFTPSDVVQLKRRCVRSVKCTTFEVLAAHTWRSWVRLLGLGSSVNIKLLFSVNIRQRLSPQLQPGFYGNGFVLGCACTTVMSGDIYSSSIFLNYIRDLIYIVTRSNKNV
ncbi:hypothetical protein CDL15_Pgr021386 [Punica granatum]|uniref:Omega-hydroxypalmitate O-feruloyl transferase n=1 Tax=Punica granatum TaxID=22663 RepID=A0A218WQF2_PUNGR|nr:hypothetical protein CDL15_Pgr021386 [Punica granatum]